MSRLKVVVKAGLFTARYETCRNGTTVIITFTSVRDFIKAKHVPEPPYWAEAQCRIGMLNDLNIIGTMADAAFEWNAP